MESVIVVGAGIGGIAVAARLAKTGYRVMVFEKQAMPGGRTSFLLDSGYRFDTGPTLFLMPDVFSETYAALGERMEDHLELIRLDPTYRIHFHDGSNLDLTSNLVQMREQLEALEPGVFINYLRFLAEGARHYRLSLDRFVSRNFYSIFEYLSPQNLPLIFQLKALTSHAKNTAKFFKDPQLQAAFSFQNMYLGLSPFEAPATFSLLQYTELCDGVWFPRGGLYRSIETLVEIAKNLGVRFYFESPVQQIGVSGSRVNGVVLSSGETVKADIVIANADLPYVYASLLPQIGNDGLVGNRKFTSSALMFFWGIKGERNPKLLHHNMFLADHEYKASFDQIFKDFTLPKNPSFYLNLPSRTDSSFAPEGGDGMMALVPVGRLSEKSPQDWNKLQEIARKVIFNRLIDLGFIDIQGRLEFETSWGPQYYQNELNLANGSAFGLSHNFSQIGYFRPHNRHPKYQNLYFVGASTHPGTGLPIVLLSARLTSERIQKELPIISGSRNPS